MKYAELNDLWNAQEDRLLEWRNALREQAVRLRNELVVAIEAPPDWSDPATGENRKYVDLLYLPPPEAGRVKGQVPDEAITDNGEMIFSVSFVFEASETSPAREVLYVPVALHFSKGAPQYAFWNMERAEVDGEWESEPSKFIGVLLERVKNYVSSDPFIGFVGRTTIGFV